MRRILLVAIAAATLASAGLVAGTAATGQTATGTSTQESTTTVPPTTTTEPSPPPGPAADMPLAEFREKRHALLRHTNEIRRSKCRRTVGFRIVTWKIRPDRRDENLSYWRERRARARALDPICSPRDIGRRMAAARGWTGWQFEALDRIWTQESGWHPCKHYPSKVNCGYGPFPYGGGRACGIPQFLPCSKLIGYHRELGQVSVREQIRKGLNYIRDRYGNPGNAYAFKQANGWY